MNAEDCSYHRDLIDDPGPKGIYYPWTCACPDQQELDAEAYGVGMPSMSQCQDCEAVFPLLGNLSNPADEGWCTLCDGAVERL